MKLVLVALAVLMLAGPCSAGFVQDFQDTTDHTTKIGTGFIGWRTNITAGNSYVNTTNSATWIINSNAESTTYAAGTVRSATTAGGSCWWRTYSASLVLQGSCQYGSSTCVMPGQRVEMVSSGTTVYWYINGVLRDSYAVTGNPAYVGFGSQEGGAGTYLGYDDIVYGDSEDKIVIGIPEDGYYYIKKDMVNPASSGLFNVTTGALVYSSYLPYSFSRSALNGLSSINESIYLINSYTGTVYATQYTGTSITNIGNFDIDTALISSGAPYGWYQIKINNTLSNRVAFIANGANIAFDDDEYSQGDEATITYLVDSDYWLLGEYTYRIDIIDVYGTVHYTENIATSEGTVTYTWDADDDTQGVYYAEIIADRISDGEDVLLNYDYATLTAAFGFTGYVNAAQTALPIEAANVSYAQGDTVETDSSGFDGNYSVSGFLTGIPIWANVSADGYETQNFTFTVMNGHTITRNITLNATSPSYTGLGIGGISRDGVFTSPNSITNGYGRPIPAATCFLKNTTNAELYNTTGNNAGWYLFDESTPAFLTANRPYDLWCQRSGYGNSLNYTVMVTV